MISRWEHHTQAFAHLHQFPSTLRPPTAHASRSDSACAGVFMLHSKPATPYGLVHMPRRPLATVPNCAVSTGWAMASIPAGSMLLGGLIPLLVTRTIPKRFVHAMQHFSAGMLLAAIAQEMVPPLVAADKMREIVSIIIGFSLGVAVMIGLEAVMGTDGEDEGSRKALDGETPQARITQEKAAPEKEPPAWRNPKRSDGFLVRLIGGDASKWWSLDRLKAANTNALPLTLALAVYIDAAVDGLLIGLALASQAGPGLFLALALAVEMFFLGMTFSTSCQYLRRKVQVMAIAVGPCVLLSGSYLGGQLAAALAVNNAALVGGIAFAAAALLYMVCEELLLDAHEDGQTHVWWIDLQVYLGFMLSLVLEKLV